MTYPDNSMVTTVYSYWLEEVAADATGDAAEYTKVTYEGDLGKDAEHSISGTSDAQTIAVNVTNEKDNSGNLTVRKVWKDWNDSDLANPPENVTVEL